MSAPLVVNTADGTVWTRRSVTRGGLALYAPEGVCRCPEFVMATLAELAEHGIAGSADVLPMPAGTESGTELERLRKQVTDLESQLAALTAQGQVLRQSKAEVVDDPYGLHHDYRLGRELQLPGGAP